MLIRQLKELEADQIISRRVYPEVPPKVEYRLTAIGEELAPVINTICHFGDQYHDYLKVHDHLDSSAPE